MHELRTWSINIIDNSVDSLSAEDENNEERLVDPVDDDSVDGLEDILKILVEEKEEKGVNTSGDKDLSVDIYDCHVPNFQTQPTNDDGVV